MIMYRITLEMENFDQKKVFYINILDAYLETWIEF